MQKAILLLLLAILPATATTIEEAARSQVGVTTGYDPSYVRLSYPDGDVPQESGVCTDVVIRALRKAKNFDLQKAVHEDMKANFSAYPKNWGHKAPDANIDHRRVPNLEKFFERKGWKQPIGKKGPDYKPGDIVTVRLPGGLPHIMIVSSKKNEEGTPLAIHNISTGGSIVQSLLQAPRFLGIHNIGAGTREEDCLFTYRLVGHYRFPEKATDQ